MKRILFLVLVFNTFLFAVYNDSKCVIPDNYYFDEYTGPSNSSYAVYSDFPSDVAVGKNYDYACGGNYKNRLYVYETLTYVYYRTYKDLYTLCEAPNIYDNTVYPPTCKPPLPSPDDDGDGTPNKCDFKHPDYSTLDCDGDGIPNSSDNDLDGDGTDNSNDADMNGNGSPDAGETSSPTYNDSCIGADMSASVPINGTSYSMSYYTSKGAMLATSCNALLGTDSIDSTLSLPDKNRECVLLYCFVHMQASTCNFSYSDFIPQGSQWIYKSSAKTESECSSFVDGATYSSKHFVAPDLTRCPDSKYCYLKRVESTPLDNNYSDYSPQDLNSTSTDLKPLLEASNKANEHLSEIKTELVTSNKNLEDLKKTSNEILNKNESMDSSLKDLKSNSDKSLENDLESLSALLNISDSVLKTSKASALMGSDLKAFSDTSTKNQVIGNASLGSIDGKMTTNNNLLSGIKSAIEKLDSNGTSDGNTTDDDNVTNSLLSRILGAIESLDGNVTSDDNTTEQSISFLSDSVDSILKKYTIEFSGASCGDIPPITITLNGRTLTFLNQQIIDMLPVSAMRSVIIFIFTIAGLILAFRGN